MYPMSLLSEFFDVKPSFKSFNIVDFDAWEEENNLVLEFPLPGYEEGEISVVSEDGVLTVEANQKQEENKKYLVKSSSSHYSSSVSLPRYISGQDSKVTYKKGVLRVELPKKEETKRKKLAIEYKDSP